MAKVICISARDIFVQELARVRERMGFCLIGYVVMPEHVHLLLSEPRRGTPSTVLHDFKLLTCCSAGPRKEETHKGGKEPQDPGSEQRT